MSKRIKIGISCYNDYEYLELLLQSIRWYTLYPEDFYDVVVCDDGSTNAMLTKIREVCAKYRVDLIEHGQNLGIPATWNHLVESLDANHEIMVLLNNDMIMPPDWLRPIVFFLDENRHHKNVGSTFWNPVNGIGIAAMREWLPKLTHTTLDTRNLVTGQPNDFMFAGPMDVKVGDGHGLGRAMCPCGACFAFTDLVWKEVGIFDENITSFFEESDWGTRCAKEGRVSLGHAYPRPMHHHGAAFGANPELKSDARMVESRAYYRLKWSVPNTDAQDFKRTHERFMRAIPPVTVKYLRPVYDQEPENMQRPDGVDFIVPRLVEFEETFKEHIPDDE